MFGALLGGLGAKLIGKATRWAGKRIAGGGATVKALPAAGLGGAAAAAAGRVLPGIGRVGAVMRSPITQAAAGTVAGAYVYDQFGNPVPLKRRRGRGFSARDIKQTRRMLRLIKDMQGCIPKRKC